MNRPVYTLADRTISLDGTPVMVIAVPRKPQDQGGGFYTAPHDVDALARRIVALLNYAGAK